MITLENQKTLIKKYGNEWIKGNYHRYYLNNLPKLFGLETMHYNTGNISSATLNGDSISNSRAYKILSNFVGSKIWYDANDGEIYKKNIDDDEFDNIIENLNKMEIKNK